ncbi:hypothetical protein [uncultured Megasphaera sp.]|uniref:hypothetical protein n=1 Tax=uncultured Megasphaera sp. TaxID=165188 RepID=UPI00265AE57A|nr:hypothetical protein [uncultured Megasphaera sp.]
MPEIFQNVRDQIEQEPKYSEYNIKVEHYIVSTGLRKVIEGSAVAPYVDGIWGCDFIEDECDGQTVITELGYTLDNTTKTRALFEISKGVPKNGNIDVNAKMPQELRRVRFENMIYIADGPSDIPAFSVVNRFGGATFAIYPPGDTAAFQQVETLRRDGRVNMYAEADYREGTTAYMWITNKVQAFADRIYTREKQRIDAAVSQVPKHLT